MSYSIPSSTKILNLTTAPFLFILVSAMTVCKFAMVPVLYILLYLQEEEVHFFFLMAHIYIYVYIYIQQHNHQKRFKPLSVTILLWQGHY